MNGRGNQGGVCGRERERASVCVNACKPGSPPLGVCVCIPYLLRTLSTRALPTYNLGLERATERGMQNAETSTKRLHSTNPPQTSHRQDAQRGRSKDRKEEEWDGSVAVQGSSTEYLAGHFQVRRRAGGKEGKKRGGEGTVPCTLYPCPCPPRVSFCARLDKMYKALIFAGGAVRSLNHSPNATQYLATSESPPPARHSPTCRKNLPLLHRDPRSDVQQHS